jgi:hypothetical protein
MVITPWEDLWMKRLILGTALGALALLSMAASAGATVVLTGDAWTVSNTVASSATLTNVQAQGTPNAVWTSNGISYSSYQNTSCFGSSGNTCTGNPSAAYTIDSFIKSIPGTLSGTIAYNPSTFGSTILSDGSTTGMLFRFDGTAFFQAGQHYTFNHDDGVTLLVGGTFDANGNLVGATAIGGLTSGPTSPITENLTYSSTDPTGTQNVELIYGECCTAPAVLNTSLFSPSTTVPEPASIALFGSALLGFGIIRRRRNRV